MYTVQSCEPLVSVIIPTYNRADLLDRAICSVFEQSYLNFEILVIDDHSTDGTEQRIRELEEIDSRIRYLRNTREQGVSNTRNVGLDAAEGEYIAFLDSDDLWEPHHVEWAIACFSKAPEATFYFGNRVQFDLSSGLRLGDPFPGTKILQQITGTALDERCWLLEPRFHELLYCGNPMAVCSVVIRNSALRDLRFDPLLKAAEDRDFWLRVLLSEGSRVLFRDEVVTLISRHDGNMSGPSADAQLRHLNAHFRIFKWLLESDCLTKEQKDKVRRQQKSERAILPYVLRRGGYYGAALRVIGENFLRLPLWVTMIELVKTVIVWARSHVVTRSFSLCL
ncbi:MAG: glycosyltransferase [candidate division Zixibacteria bacterium]|nr:glycosyltransferase [candidate division Zixibacteria bacterium]